MENNLEVELGQLEVANFEIEDFAEIGLYAPAAAAADGSCCSCCSTCSTCSTCSS